MLREINKIAFFGLGRIGLPQSLVFANKGFKVYGFDTNPSTIENLNNKLIPFDEPKMENYLNLNLNRTFFPIFLQEESKALLNQVDAIVFAIGTSVPGAESCLENQEFDLSSHFSIVDGLFSAKLKKGIVIIFRTTFPLGSTDRIKNYIEGKFRLIEGLDFHLVFMPERLMEGRAIEEEETLPKIVGTYNNQSFLLVKSMIEKIGGEVIRVDNPLTAEFCKLTDNSFRNTAFSFANEIAMYGTQLNIDVNSVIKAVNNGYPRNNIPKPGFVSGYCLGKDPYIFEQGFKGNLPDRKFHSIWYYGRKTNDYLVSYVTQKVLNNIQVSENTRVAILGLAFKEDIDDFRMSHSLNIIENLIEAGIKNIDVYDPALNKNHYTKIPDKIRPYIKRTSEILNPEFLKDTNAIIVCHRHKDLIEVSDPSVLQVQLMYVSNLCYLFDAWNIWGHAKFINGIVYQGLGSPSEPFPLIQSETC